MTQIQMKISQSTISVYFNSEKEFDLMFQSMIEFAIDATAVLNVDSSFSL